MSSLDFTLVSEVKILEINVYLKKHERKKIYDILPFHNKEVLTHYNKSTSEKENCKLTTHVFCIDP